MKRNRRSRLPGLLVLLCASFLLASCAADGANGKDGATGPAGSTGVTGPTGTAGAGGSAGKDGTDGNPAVVIGTIAGTVVNGSGTALAGAAIVTIPASISVVADSSGAFTLSGIAIGTYTLKATKSGYVDQQVAAIGVAAGKTTTVQVVMTAASMPSTLSGKVVNAIGVGVAGAIVSVEGTTFKATSDASGTYSIAGVPAGMVFLYAQAPAGFLDGETRDGIYVPSGANLAGLDIGLSSRPSDSATYVGESGCTTCHASELSDLHKSAHYRSISDATDQILQTTNAAIWPAIGGTVNTSLSAVSPTDGTTSVAVYACQNAAGVYSFKFGGSADCTVADGSIVPVKGTYGGQGDGGHDDVFGGPNVGKWKQRFLARLADVPNASGWGYTSGKTKDWLILPIQITQSGDNAPVWGGYHGSNWNSQGRTFSKKCSGCHNTGLQIVWDGSNNTTSYGYTDLNITCEKCHGPASEHVSEPLLTKKTKIIVPSLLTASAERELCGQCHAADAGTSMDPSGGFGYAYNNANSALIGRGNFVPGVYKLDTYIKGLGVPEFDGGGDHTWPDGIQGKAHRQQLPQLLASKHVSNPYEQLTCTSCHNKHTLYKGSAEQVEDAGADSYTFSALDWKDNQLCFACHATHGPFADLSKADVAALESAKGDTVLKNGSTMTFAAGATDAARLAAATVVGKHMQDKVNMGKAVYQPTNDAMPTGRCSSCHMPKIPKSGGYTTGLDADGKSALVEGDQGSHAFRVVWPWESAALKTPTSKDTDIMPNSCGKCHAGARISGD